MYTLLLSPKWDWGCVVAMNGHVSSQIFQPTRKREIFSGFRTFRCMIWIRHPGKTKSKLQVQHCWMNVPCFCSSYTLEYYMVQLWYRSHCSCQSYALLWRYETFTLQINFSLPNVILDLSNSKSIFLLSLQKLILMLSFSLWSTLLQRRRRMI